MQVILSILLELVMKPHALASEFSTTLASA